MKSILSIILLSFTFLSCDKDKKDFTLESIKLNAHRQTKYGPTQNLFIKIIALDAPQSVLGTTDIYPSNLKLPVTYAVHPTLNLKLYKSHYLVQLWGDVSGLIASSKVDMEEYKIIFPIEMETGNDDVSFSLSGSWK